MFSASISEAGRTRAGFFLSLIGLAILPLAPEAWLWLRHYDDFKAFASIAYYESIASFFMLAPVLFLPRWLSRGWLVAIAAVMALATLATGFQAITVGARWDSTAHAAVFETNSFETRGFVSAFISTSTLLWLGTLIIAFVVCVWINLRSAQPTRRAASIVLVGGLLITSYGVHNAVRYGGNPFHRVTVSDDTELTLVETGNNSYHPVLRLLGTHWNYVATHGYRMRVLRDMGRHLAELKGTIPIPGATPPRIVLLVIGESASRRHWSLYGYARDTNPKLASLGSDLFVYRDAVCHTVGTLTEIQGMLCTRAGSIPVFALFADAGYRTHWFSAQLDQGPNDVKLAAIVQSCEQRVFLNGAYDENLIPLVRRAVEEPGKHFIVVNLFGSHVRYDDRYPDNFAVFNGTDEKTHRIAAYDNSIRYTDYVLFELINILRARPQPSCFLYLSDHAEDVYDSDAQHYLFRSDSVATDAMYEIPMVAWLSPEYQSGNTQISSAAAAATARPFQSLGLYHSLIDLIRVRHSIYDPTRSLFSTEYVARERHIGVMERTYQPAPSVSNKKP